MTQQQAPAVFLYILFSTCGEKILATRGIERSHLFTAEPKPPECTDYVREKVFAIDFDDKTVRVAKTLNLIAGDGKTNVLHLNTLDYGYWDEMTKSEAWIDTYNEGWKGLRAMRAVDGENRDFMFDIVMANPPFAGDIKENRILQKYELAKNSKGNFQNKVGRDILFIERNLSFLKPGGRMAIILPQGRFNNSSDKYIRDYISERCKILAVVGLHGNVFKPHTGTKTSVLFVQKWDDKLCPYRENYPVFFANMQKPSKDNSGEKIYVKDKNGNYIFDNHDHLIVDHDLFNHDGKTQDGIAEAFIEFAKREGLSFFAAARSLKPFDEEKYRALMDGLNCQEIMISDCLSSDRFDAEFYDKKFVNIARKVRELQNVETLSNISRIITDGDHATREYYDEGIMYILSEYVKLGYIDTEKVRYISPERHKYLEKSALHPGDVVVTKTGYFGKCAVVPDNMPEANISADVGKIALKERYNPYFLSAFLNCNYGFYQMHRKSVKTTRPRITLVEFQDILVPKFSDEFDTMIEKVTRKGIDTRENSTAMYKDAEQILLSELDFNPALLSNANVTIKSFAEVFQTGRLDAEYFMPKYDDIISSLNASKTVADLCTIHDANFTPAHNSDYKYIELANVGMSGEISNVEITKGDELPSRARRKVYTGQVIISSIEGSLQSCALITDDYDNALCSTGFYVMTSEHINSETLLILFKSQPIQELMKQRCSGTILTAISKEALMSMPLPMISTDTQRTIADKVQTSFSLRKQSEKLISIAVKSVELAIEQGKQSALSFINHAMY